MLACREPLAITVAATTPEDARLWISPGVGSNYGRCVDIWAPGSDILSASHRSDRATEYRSGTSQAVPFVAGAAVLFLQNSTGASHGWCLGAWGCGWGLVQGLSSCNALSPHDVSRIATYRVC